MAQVLGKAGRYVSQEAARKRNRIIVVCMVTIGVIGIVIGLLFSVFLPTLRIGQPLTLIFLLLLLVVELLTGKYALKGLDALAKQESDMLRGAVGEVTIGTLLKKFPDEFRVINDLAPPFGNIDHIVVGPTGVFLIDTKNWRGVVSANVKGELLHNGKPTDKPYINQFTGRIMGLKKQVQMLAGGLDPYFQGIFVFPSARVEADFGKTGWVHCICDERLYGYIVESPHGKKLQNDEIDKIAQAFVALARMDKDFESNAVKRTAI